MDSEADWIIDVFGALIEEHGADAFIGARLVLPTPKFFPDAVEAGPVGYRMLVRRMMHHAGLGDFNVRIGAGDNDRAPVQFQGWREEDAHFSNAVHDATGEVTGHWVFGHAQHEAVIDYLTLEVALAFRSWDRPLGQPDEEELAASGVTAVLLGLGVLALNSADRHRSQLPQAGVLLSGSDWVHYTAGTLPVETLADALAIQTVVRGTSSKELKTLTRHLQPNQAKAFEKARISFEGQRDELIERLGVGPESEWPKTRLTKIAPLDSDDEDTALKENAELAKAKQPARIVYRIRRPAPIGRLGCGLFPLTVALGLLLAPSYAVVAGGIAIVATASFLGVYRHLRKYYECSNRSCFGVLEINSQKCPGCGYVIRGDADSHYAVLDLPMYEDAPDSLPYR